MNLRSRGSMHMCTTSSGEGVNTSTACISTSTRNATDEAVTDEHHNAQQQQQQKLEEYKQKLTALFNADITSEASRPNANAAERAHDLLDRMYEIAEDNPNVEPNYDSYIPVLKAYASSDCTLQDAGKRADNLHGVMISNGIAPCTESYNAVLQTISSQYVAPVFARRSREILREMEGTFLETVQMQTQMQTQNVRSNCIVKPDLNSYFAVISAFCKCGAPEEAESLLRNMVEQYDTFGVSPNLECFNKVIYAYSHKVGRGDVRCARRVNHLLELIAEQGLVADTRIYNAVVSIWTKVGGKDAAQRAEKTLMNMVSFIEEKCSKDDMSRASHAFHEVITCWARSGSKDAGYRAEAVLDKMVQLHQAGYDIRPSIIALNTVITAWTKGCKGQEDEVADRAERLLDCVHDLGLAPTVFTYRAVIDAWAKAICLPGQASEAVRRADALLADSIRRYKDGNEDMKPHTRLFTAVINVHAKAGSAATANKLLQRMEELYRTGMYDTKPDVVVYTEVINAWAKSNDPEAAGKAEELLHHMIKKSNDDDSIQPNSRSFTCYLLALANTSGVAQKYKKAEWVLNTMDRLYNKTRNKDMRPNAFVYNYVINVCATACDNETESFSVAANAFKSLHQSKYAKCDSYTYSFFIKACSNLLLDGDDRSKLVVKAYRMAMKDGFATDQVNYQLKQTVPAGTYSKLVSRSSERPFFS